MRHIRFLAPVLWILLLSATHAQIPIKRVTASSFDERGSHYPTNTLALDETRWSAQGKGQWIRYELADGPWQLCRADLQWYQEHIRRQQFQIRISRDGKKWTKVFDGLARKSRYPVSYSFPDVCGQGEANFVQIIGMGNTKNDWNSLQYAEFLGISTNKRLLFGHPTSVPTESCAAVDLNPLNFSQFVAA